MVRRVVTRPTLGRFSTLRLPNTKSLVVRSHSVDPCVNLAFEDWLLQTGAKDQTCLLLWRDRPCVVIGRNQNPWIECNVPALQAAAIPIVRRYSGGGTVYHDLGNCVYSVIMPRGEFSRVRYAQMVVEALAEARPGLQLTARHDIFYRDAKVSGSAYRLLRDRAYHHGTMLLSSDLQSLAALCTSPIPARMHRDGATVSSVVSPVANIGRIDPPGAVGTEIDHGRFSQLLLERFRVMHGPDTATVDLAQDEICAIEMVRETAAELSSWAWTFAKSPPFSLVLPAASIDVRDGVIVASSQPALLGKRLDGDLLNTLFYSKIASLE